MPKPFEEAVDEALRDEFHSKEINRKYGITRFRQRFALVTTNGLWYAVRLFMDEDHRDDRTLSYLERKTFLKEKDAEEYVAARHKQLESLTDELFDYINNSNGIAVVRDVRHLNPGDHILTECYGISTHEGIFVGDGKIIHISPDKKGRKKTSYAKEEVYAHFETRFSRNIAVQVYRVRLRLQEDIVRQAREYAKQSYGDQQYHLLNNNCQHFASLCACGQAFTKVKRHIGKSILLLPAVLAFGPIILDETDD